LYLVFLLIGGNKLQNKGMKAITSGLLENSTLSTLILSIELLWVVAGNEIGVDSVKEVGKLISENKSLVNLDLSNKI